jgi:deoxycytidine triphosphate deaminase
VRLLDANTLQSWLAAPHRIRIAPFEPAMLHHATYYLRLGDRIDRRGPDGWTTIKLGAEGTFELPPAGYVRVWTMEDVSLTADAMALVGCVSDLIESGLVLLHSPFIDPLFSGRLRFGLYNLGGQPATLRLAQPIGKVAFFDVAESHVPRPQPGSIMDRKLSAFRDYIERSDISPFPPEALEDDPAGSQ